MKSPQFLFTRFRAWRIILPALWVALAAVCATDSKGRAADLPSPFTSPTQHSHADLLSEVSAISPGQPFWVAVRMKMDPGWHTYWVNPGDPGQPIQITWTLPAGWSSGPIQWPTPQKLPLVDMLNYGYTGTVFLFVQLTPSANLQPGTNATLHAKLTWLECSDECVPGGADLSLTLPVIAGPPQFDNNTKPILAAAQAALPAPPSMFTVTSWREGKKLFLGLEPQPASKIPAELREVYFFSADAQTIPTAPQILHKTPAGWVLEMSRTDNTPANAKFLPGILTINGTWSNDTITPALSVNPPLATVPPAVFAGVVPGSSTPANLTGLLEILLLGFLGGLILNIMPCVFPVLGIKVLGFVKQAGAERRLVVLHGLVFTAGVLISMWSLVAVLLSFRAAGTQLGWGFQLQEPAFVLGLAIFFLLFALSLSGVFEVGGSLIGAGSNLTAKRGLAGSFFQGVLAVVVATPCTAPLLAPALGAAFALPTWQALLAFSAIALGLSAPYLLLSLFPGLARCLPRPGAWMETFKQFMAFPLYATVGFLLYTLAGQVAADRFLNVLLALVVLALAVWFYGRFATPAASPTQRQVGKIGGLVIFVLGVVFAYWPVQELNWEPWSPTRIEELQKEGRPIYVDFTARWCATCQVNKGLVFHSASVLAALDHNHVALLRADWTSSDPAITAELARFGRNAVPFDLVYLPGHQDPIILPPTLTPGLVLAALAGQTPPAGGK